ncbi:MAG: pyridoxine 5'-phosphate synthase [Alloprevotella sp.]
MTKLSVNINKVATLRNARGSNTPDVLAVARDLELFGAEGITVHPRPDERHIRYADVRSLKPLLQTEFNIEGYPSPEFMRLVIETRPAQVTLVPDEPGQLTSNAGWNTRKHRDFLADIVAQLHEAGIRSSIFIAADREAARYAREAGADRIELYTEPYAVRYPRDPQEAVASFVDTAVYCREIGLGVNAGHDLSLQNLHYLHSRIPWLAEVSIGHALVSDALYLGFHETVRLYKACLR